MIRQVSLPWCPILNLCCSNAPLCEAIADRFSVAQRVQGQLFVVDPSPPYFSGTARIMQKLVAARRRRSTLYLQSRSGWNMKAAIVTPAWFNSKAWGKYLRNPYVYQLSRMSPVIVRTFHRLQECEKNATTKQEDESIHTSAKFTSHWELIWKSV